MRALTRSGLFAVAALLGGGLLMFLYLKPERGMSSAPRYTTASVTRGDIIQAVNTTGQLTPTTSVEVSTQISGLVTAVNVDFNSVVRKGAVLAQIDASTYEQRLRQAQADLAAARANHSVTRLNAQRLKYLRAQHLVTQQEYDLAEAQLEQSQAALLTREAAVENARVDLERCTITSPIDGTVIFKQVEVGKTVVSTFAAPTLFVIAQSLSRMQIIAPISEVDVWSLHAGLPATFTIDALPDRIFHGTLTQIRNPYTPSEKQGQSMQPAPIPTFDAVIQVQNPDLVLRPSITANVSIIVDRRLSVLRIPNSALRVPRPPAVVQSEIATVAPTVAAASKGSALNTLDDGSMATVYRLSAGDPEAKPEAVSVQLGMSDSIVTEVVSGLAETDRVIIGATPLDESRRVP